MQELWLSYLVLYKKKVSCGFKPGKPKKKRLCTEQALPLVQDRSQSPLLFLLECINPPRSPPPWPGWAEPIRVYPLTEPTNCNRARLHSTVHLILAWGEFGDCMCGCQGYYMFGSIAYKEPNFTPPPRSSLEHGRVRIETHWAFHTLFFLFFSFFLLQPAPSFL